jgi:hypothetical protein
MISPWVASIVLRRVDLWRTSTRGGYIYMTASRGTRAACAMPVRQRTTRPVPAPRAHWIHCPFVIRTEGTGSETDAMPCLRYRRRRRTTTGPRAEQSCSMHGEEGVLRAVETDGRASRPPRAYYQVNRWLTSGRRQRPDNFLVSVGYSWPIEYQDNFRLSSLELVWNPKFSWNFHFSKKISSFYLEKKYEFLSKI